MMQQLPALIAPRALAWLRTTRRPRLLQSHRAAWNFVNEHGAVLALVTPAVGMMPFGWLVSPLTLHKLSAAPATPLAVDANRLSLTVGLSQMVAAEAHSWQPRPAWQKLTDYALPAADLSQLPARVRGGLMQLADSLVDEDAATIANGALALAGYGTGLTPTGDDVLVGVLYALAVWRPGSRWADILAELAAPRTTTLSAALLRCAAAAEAGAVWHALAEGEPDALTRLLAVGAGSGHEAWAGFCYAGRILRQR